MMRIRRRCQEEKAMLSSPNAVQLLPGSPLHYFSRFEQNRVRPDTRLKIKGRKNQHAHPAAIAYLIAFQAEPLRARARTHTHTLAPSILPLLKAPTKSLFWNLSGFCRHIRFHDINGSETCPLRSIFKVRNSQKSLGARYAEYGVWTMIAMFFFCLCEELLDYKRGMA
jgi:hypothetical protein